MDRAQPNSIHQALVSVQHAITTNGPAGLRPGDLVELVEAVEEQLSGPHANLATICTFLNSIARSLRTQPAAREVCLTIERAIQQAGVPSGWQSGI